MCFVQEVRNVYLAQGCGTYVLRRGLRATAANFIDTGDVETMSIHNYEAQFIRSAVETPMWS